MSLQQNLISGDMEALEVVYKKYYPKVCGIVLKYSRNPIVAEDLAQEVFLKFWRNRKQISPELSIDQQLFVLSKNIVFNHLKSQLRQRVMLEDYLSSAAQKDEIPSSPLPEQMKGLRYLIEQLPPRQQEIFKMHRFEGLTYDEIADYFKISKHTVATHLGSAMNFLRKNMVVKISFLAFLLN